VVVNCPGPRWARRAGARHGRRCMVRGHARSRPLQRRQFLHGLRELWSVLLAGGRGAEPRHRVGRKSAQLRPGAKRPAPATAAGSQPIRMRDSNQ